MEEISFFVLTYLIRINHDPPHPFIIFNRLSDLHNNIFFFVDISHCNQHNHKKHR